MAFEVAAGGRTPGKRVAGLRVVMSDGRPVTLSASVLRNVLRAADFLPYGFVVGFASMVVSPRAQRLGDLAASTLVVRERPLGDRESVPTGTSLPPPFSLSTDERRHVRAFAARADRWTPARADAVARILVPDGVAEPADVVRGWARWLADEQ